MEVASPSPSPPAPSKPPLRFNPAALLLRPLRSPPPPPTTPPAVMSPPRPSANPLTSFLSSLIPRLQRPKQPSPAVAPRRPSANPLTSFLSSLIPRFQRPKQPSPAAAAAAAERQLVGCAVPLFRPYVAQLPWHGGARAWLSRMFPRYGHYCGPNWSSGKEAGSVLWDRRPVDHLDFCCYCHDMAYDTHDQAQLLRADLAFLRCLEGSRQTPARDGVAAAAIYRSMCIFGLKTILIPYRTNLVGLQTRPNYADVFADFVKRIASSSGRPTGGEKQRL